MLSYTLTPTSINLCLNSRIHTIDSTHINYKAIRELVKAHTQANNYEIERWRLPSIEADIAAKIDVKKFIAKFTEGAVQVGETEVLLHGQPVHGVIADRLIQVVAEGFSPAPLARFLMKLQSNPAEHARSELYLWLETSRLPICDDGDFLAFKKVNNNYTSMHDGETDNSLGTTLEMPRDEVDPVRDNTCSRGFHFCSLDYLSTMGNGRTVICKIDPADVVTIPSDYSNQKGRAWRYTIVDEVETSQASTYYSGVPLVSVEEHVGVGLTDKSYTVAPSIGISADDTTPVVTAFTDEDRALVEANAKFAATFDEHQLENLRNAWGSNRTRLLNSSFLFSDSPQGFDFWYDECTTPELSEAARAILECWLAVRTPDPVTVEDVVTNAPELIEHEHVFPKKEDPTYGSKFELSFTKGDRTITMTDLKAMLVEHGQRGTSRLTGIPRTTLQLWIDKYNLA